MLEELVTIDELEFVVIMLELVDIGELVVIIEEVEAILVLTGEDEEEGTLHAC